MKSTEEFTGGDGIQRENCRVYERWGNGAKVPFPLVKGSVELVRINSLRDRDLCWRAVADTGHGGKMELRPLEPTVLLPDGTPFLTWEQPAKHRRTFYVAQDNPAAQDDNPGTETKPWKTIGKAATTLEPGDRVLVKKGIYREWVRPARGGTGPEAMITYEAAEPGVIISGSEEFDGPWSPSTAAKGAWMAELPDALFTDPVYGEYHPFRLNNLIDAYGSVPGTIKNLANADSPLNAPRGMVFQGGRRMERASSAKSLKPGQYWVERGDKVILHVFPAGNKDIKDVRIEVTVRPYGFAPVESGLGFIRVQGVTVENVAHRIPLPLEGAVSNMQGHHWIIQHNTIRNINGIGHIIRGNRFIDVGITSMMGFGPFGGLVEDNHAHGTGWLRIFVTENAAYKPHFTRHCLLRRNSVVDTLTGDGYWIDHAHVNLRFTENVAIKSARYGIHLEANYDPVLLDNNIIWDNGSAGSLKFQGVANATVVNNLFAHGDLDQLAGAVLPGVEPGRFPQHWRFNPDPINIEDQAGRVVFHENPAASVRTENNRIAGNIFYGFGNKPPLFTKAKKWSETAFDINHNLWVNLPGQPVFDLAAWQHGTGEAEPTLVKDRHCHWHKPGQGKDDRTATATMTLTAKDGVITVHCNPAVVGLDLDLPACAAGGARSDWQTARGCNHNGRPFRRARRSLRHRVPRRQTGVRTMNEGEPPTNERMDQPTKGNRP